MNSQENYGVSTGQELGDTNAILGTGIDADSSDIRHEGSLMNLDRLTQSSSYISDSPRLDILPLDGCRGEIGNGNRIDDCHAGSIEIGVVNDSTNHKHLSLSDSTFDTTSPPLPPPESESHCWPVHSDCSGNRIITACPSTLNESDSDSVGNNDDDDDDIGSGSDNDNDEDNDDDDDEYFKTNSAAVGGV